jgi:hypothetical protein
MNAWKLIIHALGLSSAIGILAGCSTTEPQPVPLTALRVRSNGFQPAIGPAKNQALLYVSDSASKDVYVYSYPKAKLVLTLTGFHSPRGECVDADGDVFIVDEYVPTGASEIFEYAHGGTTPIATLSDPEEYAYGCSVNLNTGDLAVSNAGGPSDGAGSVSIYTDAQGNPAVYTDANLADGAQFLAYDANGNIFIDGINGEGNFELDELPNGGTSFASIALNQSMGFPAGVQWVGSTLAIGSSQAPKASVVYEFTISGSAGTKIGSTPLSTSKNVCQFYIDGKKLIGPDAGAADVGFWKYPGGGSPTKKIPGLSEPLGAVVSR